MSNHLHVLLIQCQRQTVEVWTSKMAYLTHLVFNPVIIFIEILVTIPLYIVRCQNFMFANFDFFPFINNIFTIFILFCFNSYIS